MNRSFVISIFMVLGASCTWNPAGERASKYWEMVKDNQEAFQVIIQTIEEDRSIERVNFLEDGTIEINCSSCNGLNRQPSLRWETKNSRRIILEDELSKSYFEKFPNHKAMVESFLALELLSISHVDSWGLIFFGIALGQKNTFGLIYHIGNSKDIKSKLESGEYLMYRTKTLDSKWYYYSG